MRPDPAKRASAKLAAERNRFVAAISDEVLNGTGDKVHGKGDTKCGIAD